MVQKGRITVYIPVSAFKLRYKCSVPELKLFLVVQLRLTAGISHTSLESRTSRNFSKSSFQLRDCRTASIQL